MSRSTLVLACGAVLLLVGPAVSQARAQGADPLAGLKASCADRRSADPAGRGVGYRICAGKVASFDGVELDATLTLPPGAGPSRSLPLVVFLHGFLVDKGEYLSETRAGTGADRGDAAYKTVRWNNVWFASRGYAVLNYTARGHGASGGQIGLSSRRIEVRDTRHLTGVLADDARSAKPLVRINPARVGVLGSSYGGGQAWLLMTTRGDGSLQYGEWRSPGGRRVRLAAVVPQYSWSDLLYALVPNGHHLSAGVDPAGAADPTGIGKLTLIDGFLATAATRLTPELVRWLTRFNVGEPYDLAADPIIPEAKRALTVERSPFYQRGYFRALRDGAQRRVPVLIGQGWTDPIFPAIEGVRMYRALKDASPGYPVGMYLGDFEHLTALVKIPDLRRLHDLGTELLDRELRGIGPRPALDVRSAVSNCDPKRFGPVVRAPTWEGLAKRTVRFQLGGPRSTTFRTADPRSLASDPVVVSTREGRGCITTSADPAPGVASYSRPVEEDLTLLGLPRLALRFRTPAPDVELNSRLWDVAPDGERTLVTRGAYRAVNPDADGERITYELFGNAWRFRAGHRVELEVTQDDSTFLRPDNVPSAVTIEDASLELPVAGAAEGAGAGRDAGAEDDRDREPAGRAGDEGAARATGEGGDEQDGGSLPVTGLLLLSLLLLGAGLLGSGVALRRRGHLRRRRGIG